jgi:predicted signal transduction protein with EAL and GGDEF domain
MVGRVAREDQEGLRLTRFAVGAVVVIGAGVLVWELPGAVRFLDHAPGGFWAMALAALLVDVPLFGATDRPDLRIRSTLSVCFTFAIFVLWGAGPAILVQAIAAAVSVVGQRYYPLAGIYLVARLICAIAAAELTVDLADPRPITRVGTGLNGGDLLAMAMLAAVWITVSHGLPLILRAAARTDEPRPAYAWSDLVTTAVAMLVVAPLLTTIASWWKILVGVPLVIWNLLTRQQIRHEEQLGREPVSGLLNRRGLVAGIRALTAQDPVVPPHPRPFGIILVDVRSVLDINRTLGRDVYEKVVSVVSRRIVDSYGEDRAAQLSGEGVVIFMPDLTEPDAIAAAEAAVEVLEPLVYVDDVPFALDPVGGVALSPQHGHDLGTLLVRAELAATEARRQQRRAALYVHAAAEQAQRRMMLLSEMAAVLRDRDRHREITVLYQPQVELSSGRLVAVEALLRWTHPVWGPIGTDELIESIESSEVMHLLTRHVLTTVAAQVRRWNEQGDRFRVSVNVSVQDLHKPDFVNELGELIRAHGIAVRQLSIEITERLLISDAARVRQVAQAMDAQGIGLSLDDFGTGYASLQQLRELPLSEVKVDRSYIAGLVDNRADRAIVTSVHQLTRALGVTLVAEGVEDERTANALAALPGIIGQGWYFGAPMSVEDLDAWRQHQPQRAEDIRILRP